MPTRPVPPDAATPRQRGPRPGLRTGARPGHAPRRCGYSVTWRSKSVMPRPTNGPDNTEISGEAPFVPRFVRFISLFDGALTSYSRSLGLTSLSRQTHSNSAEVV